MSENPGVGSGPGPEQFPTSSGPVPGQFPAAPGPVPGQFPAAPGPVPGQFPVSPVPGAVAKNEALYVILGLIVPGLPALLLKDDKVTGAIQLGLWIVSWILAIFFIGIFLWIGVAVWSAVDAYQTTKLWNHSHGFIT
jgi:hypothetical protein